MTETFSLVLDKEASSGYSGHDLYRSEETRDGQPVISGLYIQRRYLEGSPERLTITWNYQGMIEDGAR